MQKRIIYPILFLLIVTLACGGAPPNNNPPPPAEKIDAKEAIQTYAQDVLGLEIANLFAGGTNGEISLPVSMQEGVELAIDLAGTTYFGVWSGGIASLSFGDSDVKVLWPPRDYAPSKHNNASLVISMKLTSGERLLFPADIEREGEVKMIRDGLEHHDVMLVPHHGSRTSSHPAWVRVVRPDIAIAQSGWMNRYRFPRPEIVERYENRGTKMLDTKHGAVSIRFGEEMNIEQFRPKLMGKRDTALQCWRRAL